MARRGYGCRLSTPVVEGTGVDLAQLGQGSYAPAMTMARRGYGCRLSTPVVEGTGVDLAQLGQGSYAPARAVGTVRLNRFRHGRTNVLLPRAHFSPKNRNRRFSARHSAVKTDRNGAFRYSEKSRAVSVACERSEVLTARKRRALQSHAVFWEMRRKNVKHRSNGRYPGTGGMAPTRSALSQRGPPTGFPPLATQRASGWRIEG